MLKALVVLAASTSFQPMTVDQFMALPKGEQSAFLDGYFQSRVSVDGRDCGAEWYYNGPGKAKLQSTLEAVVASERAGKARAADGFSYGILPMVTFIASVATSTCAWKAGKTPPD
jgi:hypothetical protein